MAWVKTFTASSYFPQSAKSFAISGWESTDSYHSAFTFFCVTKPPEYVRYYLPARSLLVSKHPDSAGSIGICYKTHESEHAVPVKHNHSFFCRDALNSGLVWFDCFPLFSPVPNYTMLQNNTLLLIILVKRNETKFPIPNFHRSDQTGSLIHQHVTLLATLHAHEHQLLNPNC